MKKNPVAVARKSKLDREIAQIARVRSAQVLSTEFRAMTLTPEYHARLIGDELVRRGYLVRIEGGTGHTNADLMLIADIARAMRLALSIDGGR